MEKVCEWKWTPPETGKKQTDSFWWDGEQVLIARSNGTPRPYYQPRDESPQAAWLLAALSRKAYDSLHPHMRTLRDFLTARLGA